MPDCGVHYLWFAFVCFLIRSPPPFWAPSPTPTAAALFSPMQRGGHSITARACTLAHFVWGGCALLSMWFLSVAGGPCGLLVLHSVRGESCPPPLSCHGTPSLTPTPSPPPPQMPSTTTRSCHLPVKPFFCGPECEIARTCAHCARWTRRKEGLERVCARSLCPSGPCAWDCRPL